MAKKIIQKKSKATVSNSLNEMFFEQKDMTLQAFRMLMFYLAKINPKRPEFTEIKVLLSDYAEMLGVELNEKAIDKSTTMLLGYVVNIEPEQSKDSKYEELSNKVQVFTQSKLLRRKSDGELILTFRCHDELKPHIFNLQSKFTKFEVWNILNLSNFQDMRMYMLLSQYKVAGERTFELGELKEKLAISKDAYQEYKIFSRDVLKKCQAALKEKTDIRFEFKSVGRPAHSVKFDIFPNEEYKILKYLEDDEVEEAPKQIPPPEEEEEYEQLDLSEELEAEEREAEEREKREEICEGFQDELYDEFTLGQLEELYDLSQEHIDSTEVHDLIKSFGSVKAARDSLTLRYVRSKIRYCNAYPDRVENRYKFIKGAVAEDWR